MSNFEQRVKNAIRTGPDVEVNNLNVISEYDGDDVGEAINIRLSQLGPNRRVLVSPKQYTKANQKPLQTPIRSQARGQGIDFLGSNVQVDDGVDEDPIQIEHNGFNLSSLQIDCNQINNNLTNAITTESGIKGVNIVDVEPVNIPVAVEFNQVSNSFLRASEIETGVVVTDIGIEMRGCDTVEIRGAGIEGYTDKGIDIVNSDSVMVSGAFLEAAGDTDVNANSAIRLAGSQDCQISNSIVQGNGDVSKGVLHEAFDPGGANERICDGNTVDVKIEGVTDIGFHIRDADTERIRGLVDGQFDTGKTTQGFLIDEPNGLATPAHDVDINVKNCTRVTDTKIGANTAGIKLEGHYLNIDNTSTIRLAGNSTVDVNLGPGAARPIFKAEQDTSVQTSIRPNRTVTNGTGEVDVDWSDKYVFKQKPAIGVELDEPGSWYVQSFSTDSDGFFTGATIQVINMDGTDKGSGVDTGFIVLGT